MSDTITASVRKIREIARTARTGHGNPVQDLSNLSMHTNHLVGTYLRDRLAPCAANLAWTTAMAYRLVRNHPNLDVNDVRAIVCGLAETWADLLSEIRLADD